MIGSDAAFELRSRGHDVVVFSRSFSERSLERSSDITLAQGEISAANDDLRRLVASVDVVLLAAGSSTPAAAEEDAAGSMSALLEPVLTVLDLMRRGGPKRLVMTSSGGTVYGRPHKLPTSEDAPTKPISMHGVNCLVTEDYARYHQREHDLQPVILRFSNVYGPGQRARRGQGVIASWVDSLVAGRPIELIGDGRAERDFLHSRDAGRAMALAAQPATAPGIYNVGSGESVALSSVLELLAEVSGRKPKLERHAARPIDVPATRLDSRRFAAATGWGPTIPLKEGLEECWEWALQRVSPRSAVTISSP